MDEKSWPANVVSLRAVADLVPYARNSRLHSEAQVAEIAASIREFGWTVPVLIDTGGTLIAGHGRVLAAQLIGLAEVPCMVARGWSQKQIRAYRIADNKLALNSDWDVAQLTAEFAELSAEGFDLSLTGFKEAELDQLFAPDTSAEDEWNGMPEFTQPDAMSFRKIVVHFKDQAAVEAFARMIGVALSPKARFTWYPPVERADNSDVRYAAE